MNISLSEQRIQNNRLRRRRELRRRRRTCVLVVIMTAFFLSTFFSLRIRAQGNENRARSKYYTSVQIQTGDTLWGYAQKYGDSRFYRDCKEYVEEVMEINSLRDEDITAGRYLILPCYHRMSAVSRITEEEIGSGSAFERGYCGSSAAEEDDSMALFHGFSRS